VIRLDIDSTETMSRLQDFPDAQPRLGSLAALAFPEKRLLLLCSVPQASSESSYIADINLPVDGGTVAV
jgi:hypothetical protein